MHQENYTGVKRQVYQGSTGKPTLGRRDTFPPLPHNALTQAIKKAISGYRRYIFYPYLDPIVEEDFFLCYSISESILPLRCFNGLKASRMICDEYNT